MDEKKYKLRRNLTLTVAAVGVIMLVVGIFLVNTTAQEMAFSLTGALLIISGMQLAFKNRIQYECQGEDRISGKEEVNKELNKRRNLTAGVFIVLVVGVLLVSAIAQGTAFNLTRITENNIRYAVKSMIVLAQFGILVKCISSDKKSVLNDAIAMLVMIGLCALNLSIK